MRKQSLILLVVVTFLAGCGSNEQLPDALGVEAGPVSGSGNEDWACESDEQGLWTCRARNENGGGEAP